MINMFLSILGTSVSASFMIAVLILLAPFLNKRYASKWKYYIWIFLAFQLILPLSGIDGETVTDVLWQIKIRAEQRDGEAGEAVSGGYPAPPVRILVEIPPQMAEPIGAKPGESNAGITLLGILTWVWAAGGMIFLSLHLASYLHYKGQVIKKGTVIKDPDILRRLLKLKRELHIKGTVRGIEYSQAASPMMIGFLKPVLVLPKQQYSQEELYFILKHELVHLKRRDAYMKLLFVAANGVHWFNPLVWVMRKEADIDMELSCDEKVIQGEDYDRRRAYTETLLSTLHKQCAKSSHLSTGFYGGKKIMKKRFRNILIKTGKKNGAAMLLCAIILAVGLGTLVGCSAQRENEDSAVRQAEKNEPLPETDGDVIGANGTDDTFLPEELPVNSAAAGNGTAESAKILTIMKEGEPEEKQAFLAVGDGYSLYLPDGEWQMEESDRWQAVVNEDVHLWAAHFESGSQAEQTLMEEGYQAEEDILAKQEGEIIYKVKIYEAEQEAWCIFYCYPMEAEEGWGRELPVIADTFAVTESEAGGLIYGYISKFGSGSVTIDQQIWATPESADWKPDYDEAAGFEVVDREGDDITYPLHRDCTYSILENHSGPVMELGEEEFEGYLAAMEYPVLWVMELEEGQIKSVAEQYRP